MPTRAPTEHRGRWCGSSASPSTHLCRGFDSGRSAHVRLESRLAERFGLGEAARHRKSLGAERIERAIMAGARRHVLELCEQGALLGRGGAAGRDAAAPHDSELGGQARELLLEPGTKQSWQGRAGVAVAVMTGEGEGEGEENEGRGEGEGSRRACSAAAHALSPAAASTGTPAPHAWCVFARG